MDWITIVLMLLVLSFIAHRIRSSRSVTTVPVEHRVAIPPDGLEAIEYFWRPG